MAPPRDPPLPHRVTVAQALDLAVRHHNAGRLAEAEDIYRRILAAEPKNHHALHLLGLIANEAGDNHRAAELIEQAIAIAPDMAEMHGNLGLVLQDLGRPDDAAARFEAALALNPNFAEGHNNLGLARQDQGRLEAAVESFNNALAVNPRFAEAHSNLGNTLKALGRWEDAAACHREAIAIAPDFAQAHNNLGGALQATGRLDDAADCYRKALSLNPRYAEAHSNLGGVLQEQGRLDEAVACYRKALGLNPELAEAHGNLGAALRERGDLEDALAGHRRAVALAPEQDGPWIGLAACVELLSFAAADETLYADLLRLLDHPAVDPQSVAPAILTALRHHPAFAAALADADDAIERLGRIPILLRLLALSPLKDLEVEAMLVRLRRKMLDAARADGEDGPQLAFPAALANHCFLNEYVFGESRAESRAVERLEKDVAARLKKEERVSARCLAALATYRPLHGFAWSDALLERPWPADLESVLARQVAEPRDERALRAAIPKLTGIADDVSCAVRAQYEEHPYPRWIKFAAAHEPAPLDAVLRGAPLRFDVAEYRAPERPAVLIAGCGTGQQALLAAGRYRNARILAVDLSLSSLSYALRKTREYGVPNIEYAQADLLGLDGIDRRFDLIECVGVLHHLADPLAGWRILVRLLQPGGVMKVGLYSETARRDVVAARALIAERGYAATAEDIRRCRDDIAALARAGDPAMRRIIRRNSFFTTSECRDLLFHVQEHRFTLPQIEAALKTLGLTFLGFELDDQRVPRRFKAAHPDAALTDLEQWRRFEQAHPETFGGMYQFWVRQT